MAHTSPLTPEREAYWRDWARRISRGLGCRDSDLIDDIEQEVLIKVLGSDCQDMPWLWRVCRNRILDLLRRERTYRGPLLELWDSYEYDSATYDPEPSLISKIDAERTLDTLDEHYRRVVELRVLGHSELDIARETGWRRTVVRARTDGARVRLAACVTTNEPRSCDDPTPDPHTSAGGRFHS